MQNPFLIGDKIYMRPLDLSDVDRCQGWINDPRLNRFIYFGRFPINRIAETKWIESQTDNPDKVTLAICLKDGDRHIGNCGLGPIQWIDRRANFGILIGDPDYWGQGHGTEATKLMVAYGFEKLNLIRIALTTVSENTQALNCYRKAGFEQEGVHRNMYYNNGRYYDEIAMAILRPDDPLKKDN